MKPKEATKNIFEDKGESIKVSDDYANYLLDEIDRRHREKYPNEDARTALAKSWQERESDRGVARANSSLEDTIMNYIPESVRAESYQSLRKNFEKQKSESLLANQPQQQGGMPIHALPKEISELYGKRATLDFTINALKQQMGGKALVGKSKAEYENTVAERSAIDRKITDYENSKNPKQEEKPKEFKEATVELKKPASMTDKECVSLFIHQSKNGECISLWTTSFWERLKFLFHGKLWLGVLSGKTQPPVWLDLTKTVFIDEN